jgi:23S rRNA pseudouridine1911/1915/1917 synthase
MKLTVKENAALLDYLLKATGVASKSKIREWLSHGSVWVDGKVVKRGDVSLAAGQTIEIKRQADKKTLSQQRKAASPFPLLYEDRHLIAMEKPPGLLSISTEREKTKTFFKAVAAYVENVSNGRDKVFIVHRLDREVSGVMLFAKSEEVKEELQENWGDTEKYYLALVEGHPKEPEGLIENWIRENNAQISYVCPEGTPGAQFASTQYRVLKSFPRHSMLEVKIETGRKHQIRVHMAGLGCPIVGDKKYGAQGSPIKRLGLHAHRLSFTHPIKDERIHLESPIPAIFQQFGKHASPDQV